MLGIRHRCGTNIVQETLSRHPDCGAHDDPEDFLVSGLPVLAAYVDRVMQRRRSRQPRRDLSDEISHALGCALEDYVAGHVLPGDDQPAAPSRVISKTPSVEGLPYFRSFLPDAYLVILIRDGRAILDSAMRSFDAEFEHGCRRFAKAADIVTDFLDTDTNPERTLLVRFEDFLDDKRSFVERLLRFIGVDDARYPYDELASLPVIGSSELKAEGEGSVHWRPVAADSGFDPRRRFESWSAEKLDRFDWLAGEQLARLGYPRSSPASPLAKLRNLALDLNPLYLSRRLKRTLRAATPGRRGR